MEVNKNQAEVNWQYPMVHTYQAEANTCLNTSPSERRKHSTKNYPFPYEKTQIGSETIYVCTKGSQWARTSEVLVMRCVTKQDGSPGTWTAFDSAVSADGSTLQCRQPVFRCLATDITQPGWHKWETNYNANPNGAGLSVDWQGALWAETRVP